MTVPVTAARQATFCTDPSDTVSEKSGIRKGNIQLPVIDDSHAESEERGVSQASSAGNSSPIYGSKSALQRFKEKNRLKPPFAIDDFSELDILSDVGLVGDSDSEVVPVVTPLSLSAKSKLRKKEPRIKVPSSKVNNEEPTIQEETTQDVLAADSPIKEGLPNSGDSLNFQSNYRTVTIVLDKNNDQEQISREKGVNESLTNIESKQRSSKKTKDLVVNEKENNLAINIEPESSFYESDWQPKKSNLSASISSTPRTEKRGTPRKYNSENKASSKSVLNQSKLKSHTDAHKKHPLSSGDVSKSRKEKHSLPKHTSENKTVSFNENTKCPTEGRATPRPKSAELAPPKTPVISDFHNEVSKIPTHRSGTWVEKNERVSGIPKRGAFNKEILDTARQILHTELTGVAETTDKMATSDGYDYESETFEEILQERNSMIKAERTYQRRIRQLEEELKGMINQCQALSDENKELRKTIDSLKKQKNEEKNNDTVDLAARIAKLETEKENLVKINEKLSLSLKENGGKKNPTDIVFVENTKLKNKNSELEKKVYALEKEVDEMSERLKTLNEEKTGKASVSEFKYRELEVSIAELKTKNQNLASKVSSLEKDKKLLAHTLDEKRVELNEMMRAMQNETVSESELKYSKERLENAQSEVDGMKKELESMRRTLNESEANKAKLRLVITQREGELKRVKGDQEHKDRVIVDLRHSVEKAREELQTLHDNESNKRELEKDTLALKSRIGSLKAEIESSIQENQRLKREREEFMYELNRLRNENAAASDAITESKRYFRRWEQERDARNKAEVELTRKQEEVESLDSRVKDGGNKINILYSRLRALEDDRNRYKGPNAEELETNNKILHDENKKLRQLLVERNMELTNRENEKEVMHSRIDLLERKQKDADVRVKQLSGWVSNSIDGDPQTSAWDSRSKPRDQLPHRNQKSLSNNSSRQHHNAVSVAPSHQNHSRRGEPQIAYVSPRSRKKGVKSNVRHSRTPPPGWEKSHNNVDHDNSNHTPVSLPAIDNNKTYTPPERSEGYFLLYQEKLRRMKERY